jgi:tetratricopeptide (TPR) repeat protein
MCVYRINVKLPLIAVLLVLASAAFAQDKPDALLAYRVGRSLAVAGKSEEAAVKYREAEAICMEELSAGIGTMDTYAVLVWALRRLERYGEVITRGEEALKIREDYRVIETMGEAYFYLGNYSASLRCMGRYLSALPNGEFNATAYFFIGEIYRFQRKFRRADIAYTAAVSLSPGLALWWYRLGSVREAAADYEFASEAYERALRINPNYREAAEGLERTRRGSA